MNPQETLSPPNNPPGISETSGQWNLWPWLAILALLLVTVVLLRIQGRLWWCKCGQWFLWSGNIWGPHTSRHLFDPYSFTHVLHGFIFYGLTIWLFPLMPQSWRLVLSLLIESVWEVVENTNLAIQYFRKTTVSVDYAGDSIANALADILLTGLGFFLARYLGFWGSLILFIITELVLLFWIRDNLLLNILMLFFPIEAVKTWQMGK